MPKKTSLNYDLDIYERKAKFKEYDLILCGKCSQKVDTSDGYFSCKYCHRETKEESGHMIYGRCNECFQIITNDYGCIVGLSALLCASTFDNLILEYCLTSTGY